jgi:hypothetical protein
MAFGQGQVRRSSGWHGARACGRTATRLRLLERGHRAGFVILRLVQALFSQACPGLRGARAAFPIAFMLAGEDPGVRRLAYEQKIQSARRRCPVPMQRCRVKLHGAARSTGDCQFGTVWIARYIFFTGMGTTVLAGAGIKRAAGATSFLGCLGFFCSRLLRCTPLGIRVLLRVSASGHDPVAAALSV